MIERSVAWMCKVTAWVYQNYHPALLFTWQDAFDLARHASLQPGSEASARITDLLGQAARISDTALAGLLETFSPNEVNFLVVSDHGMAPAHTTVNLNTLLEAAGFLKLDVKD